MYREARNGGAEYIYIYTHIHVHVHVWIYTCVEGCSAVDLAPFPCMDSVVNAHVCSRMLTYADVCDTFVQMWGSQRDGPPHIYVCIYIYIYIYIYIVYSIAIAWRACGGPGRRVSLLLLPPPP
jgi:hypothetical protein